jgi:hypothetical protein
MYDHIIDLIKGLFEKFKNKLYLQIFLKILFLFQMYQ